MSRLANLIIPVAYVLGVVSLVLAVLMAFVPRVKESLHLTPRGGLVFAMTLFLCAIATQLIKASGEAKS